MTGVVDTKICNQHGPGLIQNTERSAPVSFQTERQLSRSEHWIALPSRVSTACFTVSLLYCGLAADPGRYSFPVLYWPLL